MKKLLAFMLAILFIFTLTSCAEKYQFTAAFFPIDIAESAKNDHDIKAGSIDEEYVSLIKNHLDSLTEFVNNRFGLNISKSLPQVKSYTPVKDSIAASYLEGTIYLNPSAISHDTTFTIIHELIHYLSDNNGNVGFNHVVKYQGFEQSVGYGLTEGMTDVVAFMYCEEHDIPTPKGTEYGYANNDSIAEAYYELEPQVIKWLFTSDNSAMARFVKNSLKKVATIPSGYNKNFSFHFYIYMDILLDCSVGNMYNDYIYSLTFRASFEILCITIRANKDVDVKQTIYDEIISKHDSQDVLKSMIFS